MPYIVDVKGIVKVGEHDPRLKDPSYGFPPCPRCKGQGQWNGIQGEIVCRDCAFHGTTILEWYHPVKGAFPPTRMCFCGHMDVIHRVSTESWVDNGTCRKCLCYEFCEEFD